MIIVTYFSILLLMIGVIFGLSALVGVFMFVAALLVAFVIGVFEDLFP